MHIAIMPNSMQYFARNYGSVNVFVDDNTCASLRFFLFALFLPFFSWAINCWSWVDFRFLRCTCLTCWVVPVRGNSFRPRARVGGECLVRGKETGKGNTEGGGSNLEFYGQGKKVTLKHSLSLFVRQTALSLQIYFICIVTQLSPDSLWIQSALRLPVGSSHCVSSSVSPLYYYT